MWFGIHNQPLSKPKFFVECSSSDPGTISTSHCVRWGEGNKKQTSTTCTGTIKEEMLSQDETIGLARTRKQKGDAPVSTLIC